MSGVVRLNVGFFVERQGFFKIAQFVLGLVVAIMIGTCYPDGGHSHCGDGLHDFFQAFVLICVNIFNLLITFLLIIAYVLNLPEAYYKWNFPIFERLYTTLAAFLYLLGILIVFIYLASNSFQGTWVLALIFSFVVMAIYALDAYLRWKSRNVL